MWPERPWMSSGVISISVYRRYTPPAWAMRPVGSYPREAPREKPREAPRQEAPKPEIPKPGPAGPDHPGKTGLQSLLPAGLDAGDLFLAAMLLFLYSESHDEDFLIILIVVGLSIFQKK